MSDRYAQVIILAEDERSANLLRRYVQRALNLNPRGLRQEISPSGRGDAKHWVLSRYPIEVWAMRTAHRRTGLVVHLDADTDNVARRFVQLAEALRNDRLEDRNPDERICHAIPRRHTETWLCALTGINVDEDQDCKRQGLPPNSDQCVMPAALALYELTRPNSPPPALPSLATAIPELQRLEV